MTTKRMCLSSPQHKWSNVRSLWQGLQRWIWKKSRRKHLWPSKERMEKWLQERSSTEKAEESGDWRKGDRESCSEGEVGWKQWGCVRWRKTWFFTENHDTEIKSLYEAFWEFQLDTSRISTGRSRKCYFLLFFFPFFFSLLWAAVEPVKGPSLVRTK